MKKIVLIWISVVAVVLAQSIDVVDRVPKLTSRTDFGDTLFIRGDTLFANQMSVLISTIINAVKVQTDTVEGGLGDTTRVSGWIFADTVRTADRMYFGIADVSNYLDSAIVDSIIKGLGRFAGDLGGGSGDSSWEQIAVDAIVPYGGSTITIGSGGEIFVVYADTVVSYKLLRADSLHTKNYLRFGASNIKIDSLLADSIVNAKGRFAGDITEVVAGDGLVGGGDVGSVTLNALLGWGLIFDNDSIKASWEQLSDSAGNVTGDSSWQQIAVDGIVPYGGGTILIGTGSDVFAIHTDSSVAYKTIRFKSGVGANKSVAIRVPNLAADYDFYLPRGMGSAGQVLSSGVDSTYWTTITGSTPLATSWSVRAHGVDSVTVRQIPGDSVTTGTIPDARLSSAIDRVTDRDAAITDSLNKYFDTTAVVTRATQITDSAMLANIPGYITDSLDNYYDTTKVVSRATQIADSIFATLGDGDSSWQQIAVDGIIPYGGTTVTIGTGSDILVIHSDSTVAHKPVRIKSEIGGKKSVALRAPHLDADGNFYLPPGMGATGQVLATDGTDSTYWTTIEGATPLITSWSVRSHDGDSVTVRQIDGDSVTTGTIPDARLSSAIDRVTQRDQAITDSLDKYFDTTKVVSRATQIADSAMLAKVPGYITDSLDNYYDTTKVVSRARQVAHDSLWTNTPGYIKEVKVSDSTAALADSTIGGAARATTSKLADSSAAFTWQGIKKWHLDSTAMNFVFDKAYMGTSAEAESLLATWKAAENIAIAAVESNEPGYFNLIGWGIRLDNDSVEVNWTHLKDSLTLEDFATCSSCVVFYTDVISPYSDGDTVSIVIGDRVFWTSADSTVVSNFLSAWHGIRGDTLRINKIRFGSLATHLLDSILVNAMHATIGDLPIDVQQGGTGTSTINRGRLIYGNDYDPVGILPRLDAGQILIGRATANHPPKVVTMSGDASVDSNGVVTVVAADSSRGGAARAETAKVALLSDSTSGGAARAEVAKSALEADSTDGGAIRAETAKSALLADSTHGGAIRAETAKSAALADSTSGGAARATSAKTADSSAAFTWQGIKKWHIDSTSMNFVFDKPYLGTSAVTDSLLATWGAMKAQGYITGNQTITLSGDVSGSGATAITTTIGTDKIDSTHIKAGSIANSDLRDSAVTTAKLAGEAVTPPKASAKFLGKGLWTLATKTNDSFYVSIDSTSKVKFRTVNADTFNGQGATTVIGGGAVPVIKITSGRVLTASGSADTTTTIKYNSEFPNMVLFKGFGADTASVDSVVIRGGVDTYGNYLEFRDTTATGVRHKRMVQLQQPTPDRVDTLRYIKIGTRVFDGTGSESTYVIAAVFDSSSDSAGTYRMNWLAIDSTNATAMDTLVLSLDKAISPFQDVFVRITVASQDGHVTWGRVYDICYVYRRSAL